MLTSVQADGGVIKLLVFLLEWGLGGLGSVNRGRCQMDRPKHRTLLPNTTPHHHLQDLTEIIDHGA